MDRPTANAAHVDTVEPLLRAEPRREDDDVGGVRGAGLGRDVARADGRGAVAGEVHGRRVQAGEVGVCVDAALAAGLVVGAEEGAVLRGGCLVDVCVGRGADLLAEAGAAGVHEEGGEEGFELVGEVDAVEAGGEGDVLHDHFEEGGVWGVVLCVLGVSGCRLWWGRGWDGVLSSSTSARS